MYKTFLCFLIAIISIAHVSNVFGQKTPLSLHSINDAGASFIAKSLFLVLPVNPDFIIEDGKFYFGLTKEFSVGKIPFGRIGTEYTFVFRETKVNHLRVFYNYDIPVSISDFRAFLLSFGGGYFTDFDKHGYFPQTAFHLVLPAFDHVAVSPYLKARYTFMSDESKPDIFDLSIGFSTIILF